jgi:hypothetical protein
MTTGNVLYLVMSVGMFVLLGAVLAYQSWQGSRQTSKTVAQPAAEPKPQHGVAA